MRSDAGSIRSDLFTNGKVGRNLRGCDIHLFVRDHMSHGSRRRYEGMEVLWRCFLLISKGLRTIFFLGCGVRGR